MAQPNMKDVRGKLPRNAQNATRWLRRRLLRAITRIVVHWNGPAVAADAWKQLVGDASYHITKDWDTGSGVAHGWGLMYHIAIDRDGNIYLCNDFEDILWHCTGGNALSLGVLCVLGEGQKPTAKMLAVLQGVLDWLCNERPDISAGRGDVWGHGECGGVYGGGPQWGNATECPGPDLLKFVRNYRAGVAQQRTEPPVPVPASPGVADERAFPTGYRVRGKFLSFFDEHGGVELFGYPLAGEEQMEFAGLGKLTVQDFERARFELHGDQVLLGLVGAEARAARLKASAV